MEMRGLKCLPGRTVIKVGQNKQLEDSESEESRRTHMNTRTDDETCTICVCSIEGKDEYCSKRPARNVNECIHMSLLKKRIEKNMPFEHERSLSFRIRRVGEDVLNSSECVPFVSEYSDCTEANYCSGCNRCSCTSEGQWSCQEVFMCPVDEEEVPSDQDSVITALGDLQSFIEMKKKQKKSRAIVPPPPNPDDELIGYLIAIPDLFEYLKAVYKQNNKLNIVPEQNPHEENFETWFSRQKRSVKQDSEAKSKENTTVKFFHTVDEINEDTLKTSNKSGTITAQKVQTNQTPKISRRTILSDNFNKSELSSLHIEYNQPQDYDPHIAANKIDAASHVINKIDEKELQKLIGNYSQITKDKDLSKLVVNELKAGDEVIGDKNVPPTSNITFTPENDTLTAMAFIAGNLLSKLWDMEKDAGDDSVETEVLKHEKINDLLELFKEPLSIRQETFLKNALEKLSESLNKNQSVKNVTICETITDSDTFNDNDEKGDINNMRGHNTKCQQAEQIKQINEKENQYNLTVGVISKLNNVLGLIKKFESVQKNLKDMKHQTSTEQNNAKRVDVDKNPSFELFGTLLDKITKLLIPNKSKSKKVTHKLENSYQFANKSSVSNIFENKFHINLGKINLTTKDKLVLDYLNHIESNPNCLFRSNTQQNTDSVSMDTKGNILYNLSEFFKIKSFVDLMKLTNPEPATKLQIKPTTEIPNEATSLTSLLKGMTDGVLEPRSTKGKLKAHLKAITDDLQQLQKEHGMKNVKNVNIMDALPCIYKILYTNKVLNDQDSQKFNVTQVTNLDKLKNLIDALKIEFVSNLSTRRSNSFVPQGMTKSAKVWQRMIKNIQHAQKDTRRSSNTEKPKTYEELKDIMEKVELMGNTYKNFAIFSQIPPHKRLMLLKTLEADTKQQSFALANIKKSMEVLDSIHLEKSNEIKEFIENVRNNLKLSTKVLKSVENVKQNTSKKSEEVLFTKVNKQAFKLPKPLDLHKDGVEYKNNIKYNNIKLSRSQILNQLIMNRVLLYLKSKEASGAELNDDINYNIGKRILFYIQSGNLNIAKELFRIFIANKQNEEKQRIKDSIATGNHSRKRAPLVAAGLKEPITRFNEPGKEMDLQTREDLFKTLF
ncbi:putative leucine-rich repeat-containing protein DDB_G0290503 [Maniola hyperantus]|uniref:putative leucine-rich repeat-containing protein DDB_G0290503 n=1 Tax=Aphantopus hyperantus TaxID=2795564 RepID=UPI0037490CCB